MKLFPSTIRAFSLVEVTLALGITAFCLLALFGLLPIGIDSNRASVTQSGAANIATMLVADLRATPLKAASGDPVSPKYKIKIAANGSSTETIFFRPDGKQAGKLGADATPAEDPFYRAMLEIGKEPASTKGNATTVRILVTWPALGDKKRNAPPTNFSGSFETVIALNRG